jgi:hypothetical protein
VISPGNENAYFHSSSESDKNYTKKLIKSSNHNLDANNPFFKRNKPLHQATIRTMALRDSHPINNNLFSKLELFLDKDSSQNLAKDLKADPDKIFIVLKIKKPTWKNKKSILNLI